jgi:anti-sigma B factor antagonist
MVDAVETLRVELVGEYDIGRTAELRDSILAPHDGERVVVVDLSGVTFLDSSGLRSLIEVRGVLVEEGVEFIVVNPSDCALRLLEITGTGEMLGVTDAVT